MSRRSGVRFRRGPRFRNPLAGLFAAPGLLIFGAIMSVIGWGWYGKTADFVDSAGRAVGTVVEMKQYEKQTDSGYTLMYQPVIEFTTENGEPIRYTDPTSTSSPRHQISDKVEILYDRQFPSKAYENSFLGLYLPAAIMLGIGGIFLLAGVISGLRLLFLILAAGGVASYLLSKKQQADQQNIPSDVVQG